MKNLNHYINIYKDQLQKGDILIAYNELVKFTMQLRTELINSHSDEYSFAGILHGYMDYTYFYYSNDYLKSKKLKLGLVLNHLEMRFEIWLLGNTAKVQKQYWELLKNSEWNKDKQEMPKYSILEAVIEKNPDFDDLEKLSKKIKTRFASETTQIIDEIRSLQ